jgi:DNA-binding PadR family transcriptional regulator
MSRWLSSGLRRDCCVALAGAEAPTGQQLKAAVEAHYDDRIEPRRFRGAVEALVDRGFVAEHTDGIHDRYELTDAGRGALAEQVAWLAAQVDAVEAVDEQ